MCSHVQSNNGLTNPKQQCFLCGDDVICCQSINQSTNPPRTVVLHIVSPTKEVESDRAKHQHRHKKSMP